MHQSLFVSEVFMLSLHAFDDDGQVLLEIVRDFIFPRLFDVANRSDQILVSSLHIPRVGEINLHANILNGVLAP